MLFIKLSTSLRSFSLQRVPSYLIHWIRCFLKPVFSMWYNIFCQHLEITQACTSQGGDDVRFILRSEHESYEFDLEFSIRGSLSSSSGWLVTDSAKQITHLIFIDIELVSLCCLQHLEKEISFCDDTHDTNFLASMHVEGRATRIIWSWLCICNSFNKQLA